MKNNKIEPYKAITIYRKSSFTALLIVICTAINAQTGFINRDSEFLNINTPNVASFTKFIDNPIDLYHGTPDVSIPIDTLKDGDIELPITLRYNTSGIKVQEQASWVGLGWNLNMGGVIVQNIVGDYDGNDDSFNEVLPLLNISTPFSGYYAPTNPVAWHESFIHGEYLERQVQGSYIRRDLGKLNPDVFSFSYPGGAGKFVFDYRTSPYEIYILDRTEAIKIEVTNGNGSVPTWIAIKGFQITTPDGIRHLFRYQSNMMSIYQMNITDGNPVSISYALYQSIYPNGQTVNYTYDNYLAYEYNYSQMVVKFDSHTGNIIGTSRVRYNWDYVKGNDFYLTSISTTNYNINFNTIDRDDVYCNAKALQSISIASQSQTNVKLKEFGFTYEYFEANPNSKGWQPTANGFYPDPSWNTDYDYKRLKLKNTRIRKNPILLDLTCLINSVRLKEARAA